MTYYNPEPSYQHGDQLKVGILLANLGTPDAPTSAALRPYLRQFLSDTRIVETVSYTHLDVYKRQRLSMPCT